MKLTKDEFALWNIEEGNSDRDSLSAFTGFDSKANIIVNKLTNRKADETHRIENSRRLGNIS